MQNQVKPDLLFQLWVNFFSQKLGNSSFFIFLFLFLQADSSWRTYVLNQIHMYRETAYGMLPNPSQPNFTGKLLMACSEQADPTEEPTCDVSLFSFALLSMCWTRYICTGNLHMACSPILASQTLQGNYLWHVLNQQTLQKTPLVTWVTSHLHYSPCSEPDIYVQGIYLWHAP